jgi:hypothetical protein
MANEITINKPDMSFFCQNNSNPTFSIEAALLGMPPDLHLVTVTRLNMFARNLWQRHGLRMRDDSRLVWSLVTDALPAGWTAEKVMNELCLMHYIHNYTNYSRQFKTTIPIVKQNIEQQIFKHMPNASFYAYEYVQKYVIPIYRIRAMMDCHPNQQFPNEWPWQNKNDKHKEVKDVVIDILPEG